MKIIASALILITSAAAQTAPPKTEHVKGYHAKSGKFVPPRTRTVRRKATPKRPATTKQKKAAPR